MEIFPWTFLCKLRVHTIAEKNNQYLTDVRMNKGTDS